MKIRFLIMILAVLLLVSGCGNDEQVAEQGTPQVQEQAVQNQEDLTASEEIVGETPELPVCGDAVCDETELGVCEEDCPDCDDSDECTVDSFDLESISCSNAPIKNCCGDGFCGPEEDCPGDCPIKKMTLASYPSPFVHGDNLIADIVVGDTGTAKDVAAATAIATGLGKVTVGMLASDITTIKDKHVILIGNPCTNVFIEQLMPYENDCLEDYEEGEGRLALFVTGNSGGKDTYALVVSGYSGDDIRRVGDILGSYEGNMAKLKGNSVKV